MKKTTFLKTVLLIFVFLQSFISFSQSLVSYVSRSEKDSAMDVYRIENNTATTEKRLLSNDKLSAVGFIAVVENPIEKYAQLPYAGQVSICPDNGKKLPKLFLCGGNDSRLIETGITDAQSITWERFISGGSCATVSNSDCANESAVSACWVQIATGKDYLANTAGQFRVTIIDKTATPYVFYFNVYQNTLIPTAAAKNDIVKYGTGSCQIDGKITVGGFGNGYEYSFTTGTAPGTWQDSNVFTTGTSGNYTAFIRIKGVVGSCEFKVVNLEIKNVNFAVTTAVTSPKCYGDKGSIKVNTSDVKQQYKYEIYNSANVLVSSSSVTTDTEYTFPGLDSGTYSVVTSVVGIACMKDTKNNITIISPTQLKATAKITNGLSACNDTGEITVTATGGTAPYKYLVNINGAGFVSNGISNKIKTVSSGSYVIRVEDANGCTVDTTVSVPVVDKPSYEIIKIDSKCKDDKGQISLNITDPKGYTITYSINNGANYFPWSTVFTDLVQGNYPVIVHYRKNGNNCSDPPVLVQIGGTKALTASAGVAELAGCRPGGAGQARITNVEGGTAPYQYSFDGGGSWGVSPEKDLMPGTYIPSVKDANGCVFVMEAITIDKIPQKPVITVDPPVFNCDGTATTTVTVTNNGGPNYEYQYYIDGKPNTPINSGVFTNVPQGDHTITVTYTVLSVSTYSNLLKEDFGSGASTTTPGIATAYCFNDQRVVAPYNCGTRSVEDNQYSVTSDFWRSDDPSGTNAGAWFHYKDHTTSPGNKAGLPLDPKGRFLLVNIGSAAGPYGVLYSKPIKDVIPNQPVIIDVYLGNLLRKTINAANPDFIIELVDESGIVVASQATGIIPNNELWNLKTLSLNPGINTNLTFKIRSGSILYSGNDAVIDDILVYQLPKSCNTTADFPIVVDGSKAFSASIAGHKNVSCAGETNGEITISAKNFDANKGFQYSLDGTTWITVKPVPASTTGSITLTNLPAGTYNIQIRYDNSAGSCTFPVAQEIKNPTAVTVNATITKLATCTTGATITAVGSGGTLAYEYELRKSDGTPVTAFNNNANFTDVPVGDYVVYVRDANGCTTPVGKAISVVASPELTASLDASTDYCYTTANPATLVVNVTGGVEPFTYKLDTNASVSSALATFSFSNVAPGTHTILVTDSNNCTAPIAPIVIAPEIGFTVSLINDLTCLVNASIGNPVVTDGNGGPYTYTVSRNSAAPTAVTLFPYTATQAGSYVFTVTDSRGCSATSNTIVVTPKTTPAFTFAKTDVTCIGLNNGTITVTPSGGFTSAYTYELTGAMTMTQTTNQFTGLIVGNYNVRVIDSKGCPSPQTPVTIANPTVITAIIAATDIKCSATGTVPAVVTVTASGGTAPYKYSFNSTTNFTNANTYSTSVAGTVTAYIQDANGCQIGPLPKTIAALEQITLITIKDSGYDCTTTPAGGHVNIAASGVSSPIRFQIISGPAGYDTAPNADGEFKSLAPGTYIFQATDTKTNCSLTKSYTVNGAPDIVAGGSVLTPIKCFGGTGAIQFTVNGVKERGYDYIIRNAANTIIQDANNVSETITTINVPVAQLAGVYTITVTDRKTLCTDDYSVTLTQPAALSILSATPTNVSCSNFNSQITVLATGGTTNYTYAAVRNLAPATTPEPAAGAYASGSVLTVDTSSGTNLDWIVYVKDANGCTTTRNVTIILDALPAVTAVVNNQCSASGNTFTITATPSGTSLTPVTYGIAGPTGAFQTSPTFTVPAGTYTVYIKDKNGCVVAAPAPTIVYPQLTAGAVVTKTLDCSSTTPNATITTTISGGRAPFTYTVQKGTATPSTASAPSAVTTFTTSVSNADADMYTIVITDANGCQTTTSATVAPITNPTVTVASQVNVSCNAGNDGSVTLTGSGGSGGYEYSDDNVTFVPSGLFTGLSAAGSPYTFYVRDNKGCPGSVTVTITEPANALAASVTEVPFSCSATNATVSGTVTVNASAGTSPYTYSFNGGAFTNNNVLTLNDNGSDQPYTYAVQDAKGCTFPGNGTLFRLNRPTDLTFSNAAVTCTATTTIVSVMATNGVGALTFLITGTTSATNPSFFGPITTTGSSAPASFPGLLPGNYTFRVTDVNGCYYSESYTVAAVTPIAIAPNKTSDVLCQGGTTGSGTYTVSGNAGAYSFALTAGTIPPGTLTQSGNVLTLSNVAAGTYTVHVTDTATGCEADGTIVIDEPTAPLAITSAVPTNFNCNNDNAQITVLATGGTTNYGYAAVVSGATAPTTFASSNVVTVDTNGGTIVSWDVYVRDANGCTTVTTVTVAGDPAPDAPTVLVPNQCIATGSGFTLQVTAAAGSLAPLTYGIVSPTGAFQASNMFTVAPGTYMVYVKDRNGCVSIGTAVTVAAQLTANAVVTKTLDCSPTTPNATITTTISGGRAPFDYTITDSSSTVVASGTGITGPTIIYSAAVASTYTIVITDANGCQTTTSATVAPIANPTVTVASQVNVSCNTGNDGSVTLTGSGGSGGYTYSNNAISGFTSTATFGGLTAAGSPYTFYVRDNKECQNSVTVTITEPANALAASVTEVPFSCSATNATVSGSVTVNATDGTAPYTYSFNGGAFTSNNILTLNDNGSDQPYTYAVQDAKGCPISGGGTLFRLNRPTDLDFTNLPVTCADPTTTVSVTATNGVGVLRFEIIGTTSATDPLLFGPVTTTGSSAPASFPGLLPGNYTFRITDANGCFYTESHNIAPVTPIAVTAVKLTDVACFGDDTGSARFTVTGFSAPGNYTISVTSLPTGLSYTLSPTGDVRTLTNLVEGTYTFSVTDITTGCTDSKPITIAQPTAGVSITSATGTPVFCSNDNSQITINATGGTPSYGYAVVVSGSPAPTTFGTSNVVTVNTTGGTVLAWDVYVRDANGCVTPLHTIVNIANNGAPTASATVTNQCVGTGSGFTIVASATGGLAPYTYTINTGVAPSSGNTFTVAPGTYTITATDANGCPDTTTITVNQRLTAVAAVTKDITCATPQEATIRVNVSGGFAPFAYKVNIGGGGFGASTAFVGTSFIYTPSSTTGTTYEFEITDANGTPCIAITNVVTTNMPAPVTATTTIKNLTCFQSGNGAVTINPTVGVAPFEYNFNSLGFSTVSTYSNLAASTGLGYPYIVRDSKGCLFNGFAIVNEPNQIIFTADPVPMTCSAAIVLGSVTVNTISNGVAPFNYVLRNLTTGQVMTHTEPTGASYTFGNLSFGDYEVIVTDSQGCSGTRTAQVLAPPDDLVIDLLTTADCTNGATIIVSVNPIVIPPTPDYEFGIYDLAIAPFSTSLLPPDGATSPDNMRRTFTNLTPGVVYTFVVKDNITGCYYFETALGTVLPTTLLTSNPIVANNVTCTGTATGNVTFTLDNYDATTVNWEIFSNQTNISTGISGSISTPAPSTITTPPGLIPGTYYVKFTEVGGSFSGCTSASATFPITESPVFLDLNVTATKNDNCNVNAGEIVAIANGGTTPYSFILNTSSTAPALNDPLWNSPSTFNVDSGNYYVWVKDNRGCIIGEPVTVLLDPTPVIALSVVDKCVAQGAFGITVNQVTAGTGSYSISVDGGTFTSIPLGLPHTVSGLNSGSHTIIIRDANGCTDTETIIIDEPLVATPAITALPTCADNDGVITMSGTGGPVAGTYTYTILPTFPSVAINNATGVISGLPAGTYTVTMTDTAIPTACTTTAEVTLSAAIKVTFTTATTPALCVGDSNGSITVTLLPGNTNPTYTYEIIAPITVAAQSSNIFTGLPAGTYTVRVNSGRGCSTDDTTVVVAPATPLTANAVFPANTACSTSTVITVTASGGTGSGYTYNFNSLGFTSDNTFTVNNIASPIPVTYIVRDANGCETLLQSISTLAFNPPTNMDITGSLIYCAPFTSTSSTVTINSVTAGVGPFTYQMLSPSVINNGPSNSFAGLAAGDYMFQITDSNGCTYQELYTVAPRVDIAVALSGTTDITCFGANNGTANFTVSNSAGYTPTLTVGTGTLVFSGNTVSLTALAPGNYTLQVEDTTTGCTADVSFAIAEPTALGLNPVSNVNANCKTGAVVTVQGTGGTLNYTYAFVNDGVTPVATDYSTSPTATLAVTLPSPNAYDVWVQDANGCTFMLNVNVAFDAAPTIVAPAAQCFDGTPIVINLASLVTVPIGPVQYYTINGSNQISPSYTITAPGTYNFSITDANGCVSNVVSYIIEDQLIAGAVLGKDLTCAIPTAAAIDVTITGGTGPYIVQTLIGGVPTGALVTGVTGPVYTANPTAAGFYSFVITDSYTPSCSVTTNTVEVTTPVTPNFTAIPTDATCNAGTDGTITVTPTAGVAPFTFALSGLGANPTGDATGNYSGLPAGSYTVVITDAKGCPSAATAIIIDGPDAVTVDSILVTTPLSCGTGNVTQAATVTAVGLGGNGSYQYNFNNQGWTPNNTFVINTAGPVSVMVRDTNLCTVAAASITVDALDPPTNMDIAGTLIYCAPPTSTTSTVTINSVQDGIGPFTYQMLTPTFNDNGTNAVFLGLTAGDYLFQVTDSNGCTYQELYTVAPRVDIAVALSSTTDITCFAANNGSASFAVSNSTSYTAILTVGTGTPVIAANVVSLSGLTPGNYTLQVTDTTTGCTDDVSFSIAEPTALDLYLVNNINANCNTGAVVTFQGTGGTPNYTYAFVSDGATPLPTDYSASATATLAVTLPSPNAYDVWVQDANGCTFILDVNVAFDAAPTITPPAPQCYAGTPLTTDLDLVTTTYNSINKTYTLDGSVLATSTATFNGPGTYSLGIRDDNGCEETVNYIILPQLTLLADMTQDLTCPAPASITLIPAGGTTPYTMFEVNDGTGYVASANPFTTSTAGTYKFRVTDSQGCQAESQDVIVTPNTTPTATPAFTNVSCIGSSDGTITLTPSGGNVPYEYSLNGGTYQTSNVFNGLGVGAYSIVVRDAKMCVSGSIPVTISNPAALTVTATVTPFGCDTANAPLDAVVTIAPLGGTGVYSYSINGGTSYQTSPSFTVNTAQTINYIVVDANGCTISGSEVVLPYTPPTDMDIVASPIYCNTPGADATVTVNSVTGGVGPFIFEIISPAPTAPSSTPFSFTNLAPDTYIIKVTDANGCSTTKAILVEEADIISVTPQLINDVYCNGDSTGIIEFTVTDYITPANYSFNLSSGLGVMTQVGDVIRYTGVPAGAYTFTVTDNTSGCVASVSNFAVTEPALALDFNSSATNTNCTTDEATITVTASGGTLNYKYAVALVTAPAPAVTDYSLSNTLTVDTNNGTNMNWIVYVMDANGCAINKPQTILADVNPSNITVATYSECPDAITGTYTFTINPPTGVAPFTYSIGGGFQSSPTFVVNAPGSYDVTVKDANGCPTTETALVVIRKPLILTPVASIPVSCDGGDGQISVSATGGSGNYEYKIDGGSFAAVTAFNAVAAGNHIIGVRDTTTLCEVFVPVHLQAATPITGFALDKTDVTCNGGTDGTITASLATPAPGVNDNPVYTYTLTGTSITGAPINLGPQPSPLFTGLEAGNYTVTVTSARGCSDAKPMTVIEPGLITVQAPSVVQFGCTTGNTSNLATITVTGVTGGSGAYVNYEFIKGGTQVYFGPNNVYTVADLSGGSYIVNVYDDKGCEGTTTTPITIAPYIALDQVSVAINQAITCTNLEDITVTLSHIGAVAPTNVTYTVEDVIYDNSTTPPTVNKGSAYNLPPVSVVGGVATFTALPVGNYLITVTNTDTGCSVQGVHYVNEPNTFDLTIDNVVDVTCLGGTDGSANVTFVDRVAPDDADAFTYTLQDALGNTLPGGTSTNAGPIPIPNLAAGTYTIAATLSNTPGCTVTKNFTITGPTAALDITETHTEITCVTGYNDGTISVTATGGWPGGYEFELVAPNPANNIAYGTQNVFTGLTAGTYTIKVRDSKGCEDTVTVTLADPTPITVTATASTLPILCYGDTSATITAGTPTGGSGSYLYSLVTTYPNGSVTTDGPQLSNQFINLGVGTYQVKVTDSWGCEGILATPIVITEPAIVTASLVVASTSTCLDPATLTLSATGGTGPYEYSADGSFVTTGSPVTSGSFTATTPATFPVPVGTYHYYVRDVNGCISYVSNDITIDPIPTLVVSLDLANASINCRGDNSGVIVATAQGGLGNYVYTLLDGSGNAVAFTPTQATPGNFTSLPAGSYTVRVVSDNCNAISTIAQITEPTTSITATPSVTDITCSGSRNGKIEILASGGTGIIKYAISPEFRQFFDSNVFDKLDAGFYDVLVQDENGCIEYLNGIEVKEPSSINATATIITQEICFGDNLGAFNVDIVGGTLPYSVSLIENGTYTAGTATQTQFSFTGLAGGPIKVFIKDANNCTSEITVAMNVPVNLDPIAIVEYGCVSNASTNTVTVTLDSNFTDEANVEYALDGSTTFQISEVFTNVAPGTHTITARYNLNGCEKITMPFTIDAIAPLAIALTDGGLNEIVATTTGGVGGYQYSVNGEDYGSTDKFIIYKTDDYTVTVTDSNGCTTSATKRMEFIEIIIPNVFTPNGDGNNDTWFPINAENYKDISVYVFDRYGRKLGTFRQGQAWDGTYNGNELPSGDYWYVLKLNNNKDDREFVGNFTLYR